MIVEIIIPEQWKRPYAYMSYKKFNLQQVLHQSFLNYIL
jgi:hypothetical protein